MKHIKFLKNFKIIGPNPTPSRETDSMYKIVHKIYVSHHSVHSFPPPHRQVLTSYHIKMREKPTKYTVVARLCRLACAESMFHYPLKHPVVGAANLCSIAYSAISIGYCRISRCCSE
jgi:hypothetical protein